ncbi:MAG: type II toxin-antitoxin system RatA family toxin [Mariprofundaceae bacterium]
MSHSFEETREVAVSAELMFDVVMDIDAYPQFLPWVSGARILSQGDGELEAELTANLAGLHHSFSTVDRYIRSKLVEVRLREGPFRILESLWTFEECGENRCKVHFSIEFDFKSRLLSMVATPVFSAACRQMVHAFEQQALIRRVNRQ